MSKYDVKQEFKQSEGDPEQKAQRKALGQEPGEERIYSQLNKLLLPGGLRPFVERHPEFSWTGRDPKGMLITWAPSSASASGPEQPAPGSARTAAGAAADADAEDAPERPGSASASALPEDVPWPC